MEKINNILGNEKAGKESINTRLQAIDRNFDVLKPLQQNVNLYVSPSGDDTTGDGSEANSYKTIQKALDVLPKNLATHRATIHISNGVYNEDIYIGSFYSGQLYINGEDKNNTKIKSIDLRNVSVETIMQNINVFGVPLTGVDNSAVRITNCNGSILLDNITIDGEDKATDTAVGALYCYCSPTVKLIDSVISNKKVAVTVTGGAIYLANITGLNNDIGLQSGSNYGGTGGIIFKTNISLAAITAEQKLWGGQIFG